MDRTVRPGSLLSSDELRRKKTSFTLDLASTKTSSAAQAAVNRPKQDVVRDGTVLASPDVGLLALATPDLERFILQQAYGAATAGATTPPGAAAASVVTTPTQVLFPRSVTEEQEAYARGFLDALVELQRQRQQAAVSPLVQVVPDPRATFLLPCASPSDERPGSLYTTLTSIPRTTSVTAPPPEAVPLRSLPELLPVHSSVLPVPVPVPVPTPFTEVRPSTLNFSPVARRSAVVPGFDAKRILPGVDDSETLDLSPSGRFATRTLAHSATQKPVNTSSVTLSKPLISVPEPNFLSATAAGGVKPVTTLAQDTVPEKLNPVKQDVLMDTGVPAAGVPVVEPPVAMDVSEHRSGSDALLVCPIDMSAQEQAKLERKREKNRYAAQKCRMLKLERIDRLQQRVDELKAQNAELSSNASTLGEQVTRLRQMIVEHVEGGCQVMMVHSANT